MQELETIKKALEGVTKDFETNHKTTLIEVDGWEFSQDDLVIYDYGYINGLLFAKHLLENMLDTMAEDLAETIDVGDEEHIREVAIPHTCEDCTNVFSSNQGRPYKYEPSIWLCDDCHDQRMEE